jgi:hypothetical protein
LMRLDLWVDQFHKFSPFILFVGCFQRFYCRSHRCRNSRRNFQSGLSSWIPWKVDSDLDLIMWKYGSSGSSWPRMSSKADFGIFWSVSCHQNEHSRRSTCNLSFKSEQKVYDWHMLTCFQFWWPAIRQFYINNPLFDQTNPYSSGCLPHIQVRMLIPNQCSELCGCFRDNGSVIMRIGRPTLAAVLRIPAQVTNPYLHDRGPQDVHCNIQSASWMCTLTSSAGIPETPSTNIASWCSNWSQNWQWLHNQEP